MKAFPRSAKHRTRRPVSSAVGDKHAETWTLPWEEDQPLYIGDRYKPIRPVAFSVASVDKHCCPVDGNSAALQTRKLVRSSVKVHRIERGNATGNHEKGANLWTTENYIIGLYKRNITFDKIEWNCYKKKGRSSLYIPCWQLWFPILLFPLDILTVFQHTQNVNSFRQWGSLFWRVRLQKRRNLHHLERWNDTTITKQIFHSQKTLHPTPFFKVSRIEIYTFFFYKPIHLPSSGCSAIEGSTRAVPIHFTKTSSPNLEGLEGSRNSFHFSKTGIIRCVDILTVVAESSIDLQKCSMYFSRAHKKATKVGTGPRLRHQQESPLSTNHRCQLFSSLALRFFMTQQYMNFWYVEH